MNILIVSDSNLYSVFSSSFVHAQAAAYAALGHRVRVIVPYAIGKRDWDRKRFSGSIHRWDQDGVEIYAMRHLSISNYGKGGFNLASALHTLPGKLDRLLEDFTPDVIHAHALGFNSEIGALLKERLGVPLVVTTHGSDVSVPVERGRAAELRPVCDHVDAIVAVSSTLAEKVRICGTKTPVSVILNGFNIHSLPKKQSKKYCSVLQAGHLLEQKGFHVTIRAFAQFREDHADASLVLVGEGPERKNLEALCQKLELGGSVRFTGQIPHQEVFAEMSHAQFFVMPSIREGFGIVYLEAMASGCVTIGTEGEGIADLIVSEKNGFLVPPDDPDAIVRTVEWCLDHPSEASAIAEQGRKDAMGLTWEKNAEQYINLFAGLEKCRK